MNTISLALKIPSPPQPTGCIIQSFEVEVEDRLSHSTATQPSPLLLAHPESQPRSSFSLSISFPSTPRSGHGYSARP